MTPVLGLDLGSTTITALAVDIASGAIVGRSTLANDAQVTREDDKARGWSEWDAAQIATVAVRALRDLAECVGPPIVEAAALGLTGQQHAGSGKA